MDKRSGSGVTITDADGNQMTLEEVMDDDEAAEVGQAIRSDRYTLYHKPRLVVPGGADQRATTTAYTIAEINDFNWRRRTMTVTKVNVAEAICALIATGEEYSIREIHAAFKKKQSVLNYDSVRFRVTHMFTKTKLKYIVEGARHKGGMQKYYKLLPIASDMLPRDLLSLAYAKSNPTEYKDTCKRFTDVCIYIEEQENDLQNTPKKGIKKPTENTAVKATPEKTPLNIEGLLEEKIGEALGMKVEVTGRVEVVFKFG
jgi:hypothetical protein